MNEPALSPPAAHRHTAWLLLIPCVLAALASLLLIDSQKNYQEVFNLAGARSPTVNLFSFLSPDNPMPLYYLLIHGLSYIGTPTLHELRWFSFVCFIIAIFAAYWAGAMASADRQAGITAAMLIGLSPFMIWYGTRGTVYTLLALLTLINLYFFTGVLQGSRWHWLGYIPSALAALAIHYFFITILLTQLLFVVSARRELRRYTLWPMVLSCTCFAVLFAGWMYVSSLHSTAWLHLPYTAKPSATNIFIIYTQFLFGFQSVTTTTFIIAFWPLLVVLALLAVQKYVRPPIAIRYALFAAWAPILLMFALGWIWRPLFLSSYLIVCLPGLMLALGWYLVAFDLKALAWARRVLAVTMSIMLFIQTAEPELAVQGDYLGTLGQPTVVRSIYQLAFSASISAYWGHHMPAAGPPLHVPSDSPGVLTQRK